MNTTSPLTRFKRRWLKERECWLISIPMLIWLAVICYYPMYGLVIAFKYYIPGRSFAQCNWVGFKYFTQFLTSRDFPIVMRNTLAISGLANCSPPSPLQRSIDAG